MRSLLMRVVWSGQGGALLRRPSRPAYSDWRFAMIVKSSSASAFPEFPWSRWLIQIAGLLGALPVDTVAVDRD